MACCGGSRRIHHKPAPTHSGAGRAAPGSPERDARRYSHAFFQYVGQTGMTVVGPVTGRRYRFAAPGQIVAVDPLDRRSVATVPSLRQVARP